LLVGGGDASCPSDIIRKAIGLILLSIPEFIPGIGQADGMLSAVGTVHAPQRSSARINVLRVQSE